MSLRGGESVTEVENKHVIYAGVGHVDLQNFQAGEFLRNHFGVIVKV